ncbi:MAG TPA: hypothetical protein VJV23_10490, partial [Candidatus Polarisedimenticolia bacterium]|nr:hypothetical protein [Candidatus Polarisedimenticolia bacterium]
RTVALVPFAGPGADPVSWRALRDALGAELPRLGLQPAGHAAVDAFLSRRRATDPPLLGRSDLRGLRDAVGADLVMAGVLHRCRQQPPFAVSLTGWLIDTASGEIVAAGMVSLEGDALRGPFGPGGDVTFERTVAEAARRLRLLLGQEPAPRPPTATRPTI